MITTKKMMICFITLIAIVIVGLPKHWMTSRWLWSHAKSFENNDVQYYTVTENFTVVELTKYSDGLPLYVEKLMYINEKNQIKIVCDARSIVIGGGLRIPRCVKTDNRSILKLPLFRFLKTFCDTASKNFRYYFIFVYDYNDRCVSNEKYRRTIIRLFEKEVNKRCLRCVVHGLELIPCQYSGKPAWAQNDAMMTAYWRNITYFHRYKSS